MSTAAAFSGHGQPPLAMSLDFPKQARDEQLDAMDQLWQQLAEGAQFQANQVHLLLNGMARFYKFPGDNPSWTDQLYQRRAQIVLRSLLFSPNQDTDARLNEFIGCYLDPALSVAARRVACIAIQMVALDALHGSTRNQTESIVNAAIGIAQSKTEPAPMVADSIQLIARMMLGGASQVALSPEIEAIAKDNINNPHPDVVRSAHDLLVNFRRRQSIAQGLAGKLTLDIAK